MKKIALAALVSLSTGALASNLACTSESKSLLLKSFTINDFFKKAYSNELDGYLLDGNQFKESAVEYFITNECDNGFTFRFPIKAWRSLAEGDRTWISAKLEYWYPGLVGEAEVQQGKTTVHCEIVE